ELCESWNVRFHGDSAVPGIVGFDFETNGCSVDLSVHFAADILIHPEAAGGSGVEVAAELGQGAGHVRRTACAAIPFGTVVVTTACEGIYVEELCAVERDAGKKAVKHGPLEG